MLRDRWMIRSVNSDEKKLVSSGNWSETCLLAVVGSSFQANSLGVAEVRMDSGSASSVVIGIIPFLFLFLWLVLQQFRGGEPAQFSTRNTFLLLTAAVVVAIGLVFVTLQPSVSSPPAVVEDTAQPRVAAPP